MNDLHKAKAAEIFGVKYEDVTDDQRRYAKSMSYVEMYSGPAWPPIPKHVGRMTFEQRKSERKGMANAEYLLRELVTALDNAFISSWQSTHHWDKQLTEARNYLEKRDEQD